MSRNLWHSCGRYRLADHFEGRDPVVRRLFDRWAALARRYGPVTIYPQKTRIVIMSRIRFAGAVTRKRWLDAGLLLKRPAEHPLLHHIERIPPSYYVHHFRLTEPRQIDSALARLMREAHAVGRQEL